MLWIPPAPPALQTPPPRVGFTPKGGQDTWIARMEGRRGLLLLLDRPRGWEAARRDPFLRDVSDELVVMDTTAADLLVQRFQWSGPAALLLNESGKLIASWRDEVPKDLRQAFADAGWVSTEEQLRRYARTHPEQLDAQWELVRLLSRKAMHRPVQEHMEDLALALDRLMSVEGWAGARVALNDFPLPADEEALKGPLAELARRRWPEAEAAARKSPTSWMPWTLLSALAPWRGASEPRLHVLLAELEPPPMLAPQLGIWPGLVVHERVERQLQRLKDWPGLETYASHQATRLRETVLALTSDTPEGWERRFQIPGQRKVRVPFTEAVKAEMGKWLLKVLEAQIQQERWAAVQTTLAWLDEEGDAPSQQLAETQMRRTQFPDGAKRAQ
jgi:hypothetical protein